MDHSLFPSNDPETLNTSSMRGINLKAGKVMTEQKVSHQLSTRGDVSPFPPKKGFCASLGQSETSVGIKHVF